MVGLDVAVGTASVSLQAYCVVAMFVLLLQSMWSCLVGGRVGCDVFLGAV